MSGRGWRSVAGWGLGVLAWSAGPVWLWWRRGRYRGESRPLKSKEREWFEGWFGGDLLGSVRVAEIDEIGEVRPLRWLARLGIRGGTFPLRPAGMTLGDLIVVATNETRNERRFRSLLFHELVHVAQYRRMGTRGFLRAYLRGWAAAEFEYAGIPLEEEAYGMQRRFDRGEVFDAEGEVRKSR